jgi:formiminotetrahydrofolate cyclodeaminase
MAAEPLPGGVAAAAVASAMGAALATKSLRISLQKQAMGNDDRNSLQATLELARVQQVALLCLAEADERAYRTLLDRQTHRHGVADLADAWREATEVPIRVAESCHLLVERLAGVEDRCWPAVQTDLQVGRWLLETGARAGLLAAEQNLGAWGNHPGAHILQQRLDALR